MVPQAPIAASKISDSEKEKVLDFTNIQERVFEAIKYPDLQKESDAVLDPPAPTSNQQSAKVEATKTVTDD